MKISQIFLHGRGATSFAVIGLLVGVLDGSAEAAWRVRRVSARAVFNTFAEESAPGGTLRPNERSFLAKATETGRQQIRLAEVGTRFAENSEVRSHARHVVADYRRINDTLDALIRRKGGIANAPTGGTSETYQKLSEQAGSTFDREFVRMEAQMADDALALFEQAASEASDPDVRDFAAAQLPILRAHRNTATELRKAMD